MHSLILIHEEQHNFFLNSIFKGNLIGLYFNRFYSNMSESVPIKTYLYNIKFSDDENTILESILTSTKPSVKCFDEFGNVVFENDMQNCETKEYINQSHERIENFFCDYVDNLYCKQIINQNFVYKLFSLMHNKYFIVSEKVFNSIKIDDGEEMFNVNLK